MHTHTNAHITACTGHCIAAARTCAHAPVVRLDDEVGRSRAAPLDLLSDLANAQHIFDERLLAAVRFDSLVPLCTIHVHWRRAGGGPVACGAQRG